MDGRARILTALAAFGASLLLAAPASADTASFSGWSKKHTHWTWAPDWGYRPYRVSGTIDARLYGGKKRGTEIAKVAMGFFYSTNALSPDTLLVWGFEFRRKGGPWHRICPRKRCLFDSWKQRPWPGHPIGSNYVYATIPLPKGRRVSEVRLRVVPLTETGVGRHIGKHRQHPFKVTYGQTARPLPSGNKREPAPHTEPAPAPPAAQPPPQPAPQPAPQPPPPPPARDVCAAHPSDSSVVCTRNQGHTVDVCDRDPDGHRAYARVITEASNPGFLSPYYDDNDSQAGCANLHFDSRVLKVAVCVQYEGCSAWKDT